MNLELPAVDWLVVCALKMIYVQAVTFVRIRNGVKTETVPSLKILVIVINAPNYAKRDYWRR